MDRVRKLKLKKLKKLEVKLEKEEIKLERVQKQVEGVDTQEVAESAFFNDKQM